MAHFIKNVRAVEGVLVESEYDYGGNTRVLAPGEEISVSFDEAQTALGRLSDGVVYEERRVQNISTPTPEPVAAPVAVETPAAPEAPAAPVADVPAEKPTE